MVLKPESDQYSFESPLFEAPAVLKFDGYRWTGFTSKAGRGMPIAVEMWPD